MNLVLVPLVLIALLFRTCWFEPFSIPAASMAPTLLVGDYVMVSKSAYGYSHFAFPYGMPSFAGRLFGHAPRRGDVVVFKLPRNDETSYIKRIIGLPGDRVQVRGGELFLNDERVPRRPAGDYILREGTSAVTFHTYVETLPRGPGEPNCEYSILKVDDHGLLDNTSVYTVPPDHYFVLGDNRDNSLDSRVLSQVGYIPAENLIGRAAFIYFSIEDDTSIRSGRLLQAVE